MVNKYIIYVYTTNGKYTFEPYRYGEAQMRSVDICSINNTYGFMTENDAMAWFRKNKENFKVLFKNLKVKEVAITAICESVVETKSFIV